MKKRSIKFNYAICTMYQIFNMIVPVATTPYISRVLGPDGIGKYSYTNSICTYFVLFAALGTASYGTREMSRLRNQKEELSKSFWEIELLSIVTTFVSLAIWLICICFSKEYRYYFIVLSLQIVANLFDITWLFEGLEEFFYTIIRSFFFRILGVICLFLFIKDEEDILKYVLIIVWSNLLSAMSMWLYLPRFVDWIPFKRLSIKRHFRETLVYFIPNIAASIYTILDKTLIGVISHSPTENGNYEQATKIINIAKVLTFTSLNSVMKSRISFLFKQEKYEEIKIRINQSMDYILAIGIAICFGIQAVAREFVPIFFGEGFEKTVVILQILAPIIVIIGIGNCLGSHYYTPAGLRAKSARYIIYGSVINLILNSILIPFIQSYGASIASIVAEASITLLYVSNCNDYFSWKTLIIKGWKKIIAAVLMVASILLLKHCMKIEILELLFMEIFIGGIVYFITLILLKDSFISSIIFIIKKRWCKSE